MVVMAKSVIIMADAERDGVRRLILWWWRLTSLGGPSSDDDDELRDPEWTLLGVEGGDPLLLL